MNGKRVGVLLGVALLAGFSSQASGQGFRVTPWVGMYAPTTNLGGVQALEFGEKESTFAYGATLDFGQANRVVGFRFDAAYATSSDVPIEGVGCQTCELRSTVLTAAGALVLRPFPTLPAVRPYAVAGLGAKWYEFDFDDPIDEAVSDQTKLTGLGGLGLTFLPDSPISIFAELTDYISGFDFDDDDAIESQTQHDLFFKAGISIGIGPR
jgi:hypothetical protein